MTFERWLEIKTVEAMRASNSEEMLLKLAASKDFARDAFDSARKGDDNGMWLTQEKYASACHEADLDMHRVGVTGTFYERVLKHLGLVALGEDPRAR